MTDGLLENIIQLEKQIQAEVAQEQVRAKTWQERELALLEDRLNEARANEDERRQQAFAEQKSALEREIKKMERDSADWCHRLSRLDEATLYRVLKQQLAVILPGGDHDHPHGQS